MIEFLKLKQIQSSINHPTVVVYEVLKENVEKFSFILFYIYIL